MPPKHTHSLQYHNGHFYNPETKERLVLSDGAAIELTAHPADFLPFEPAGDAYNPQRVRTEEDMRKLLTNDPKVDKFYRLLEAGSELRFALHPPKPPVPGAKVAEYTFRVRLDEPLFVYISANAGKEADTAKLVDSACRVIRAERTNQFFDSAPDRLRYFEPVFAHSLNSLIKNTYVHYFQNAGAPGRSAFEVMLVGNTTETLKQLRKRVLSQR
ncbi:hypothetical protein [Hymenobacter guriensis]|uniref:Uncharacterized protein n=1 Tax=Hymenobacter guriensis TaxID=2793065 RepID=A0ABS0L336_9BACT|nr:hypothetical protein [Hymenobacter guriensis]MBG8553993.1 hypothetical protein [Hymenobacter guriensis]